ncbi:MAG: PIN domain-containing protein, partial [Candidatus Aenigmatarchaeota archaeon]
MSEKKKIIPDTSVLIDGKLSEKIEDEEIKEADIVIPEAVMDELQAQASKGREVGFEGLDEIKKLRELSEEMDVTVSHKGKRPSQEDINLANKGRIDAIIKDHAEEEDATLYTEDYVQAEVAEAEGIDVVYIETEEEKEELLIGKFFDDRTMSVHLTEGNVPRAKRGEPGHFELQEIGTEEVTKDELEKYSKNIMELVRRDDDAEVEMSKKGAEIVQYKDFRIVITKPPFSLRHEITAVRPIAKLELDDYDISDKLMKRFEEKAEGILIAGRPGSGKTTFAQALAEFDSKKNKVVK